ncbi:MAG: sugar phosphate nucleotidyltransferase [Methanoregula sp.]
MLPVVILAGGLAKRLYPVTRTIPKALITVAGRPFIDHQLALLKEKGVKQVVLCIGNLGSHIEEFIEDGSRWGIEVQYSYDGDVILGTGGAIKKAIGILPDTFMIMYGDSYLDIDFDLVVQRFFAANFPVLMTVFQNQNEMDVSNIIMKDGRIVKYNKNKHDPAMNYIDYGLIVVRKEIFDSYPSQEPFDLSLVLSQSVDAGRVLPYEIKQRFYEIGSVQGIRETEDYIRNRTVFS